MDLSFQLIMKRNILVLFLIENCRLFLIVTHRSTVARTVMCRQDGRGRFQFTSLCRGQKPASKCIRLVYEILVRCRALQALYTPRRCELMKTKTNNINCSYRIFIVSRSPVSPVFWARVRLSNNFLPKQSSCTQISR